MGVTVLAAVKLRAALLTLRRVPGAAARPAAQTRVFALPAAAARLGSSHNPPKTPLPCPTLLSPFRASLCAIENVLFVSRPKVD